MDILQSRANVILERLGFEGPRVAEVGVLTGSLSRRLLNRTDLHLTMVDNWLPGTEQSESYKKSGDHNSTIDKDTADVYMEHAVTRTNFAADRRTVIRGDSAVVGRHQADDSFDLVFIDADHSYEGAQRDIAAWWNAVKPGGYLAGHDYDNPKFPDWGVKRAVQEFAASVGLSVELDLDTTWLIRKPGPVWPNNPRWFHNGELIVACVMVTDYCGRGDEYVQVLKERVERNLRDVPHHFLCFSDKPIPGVDCREIKEKLTGWWNKLYVFQELRNERVLFLDLDVLPIDELESSLERLKGHKFVALADWYVPTALNSSVMYWEGDHSDIYRDWIAAGKPAEFPETGTFGDQAYILTRRPDAERFQVLLPGVAKSYKAHDLEPAPPAGTALVCFHGEPKPHQLTNWVKDFWKVGGLSQPRWLDVLNNSDEEILKNIETNRARGVPKVQAAPPGDHKAIALCCGGPSLEEYVETIRSAEADGLEIWAVNGTADYLADRGIVPDVHVLLDSRGFNAKFVERSRAETRYLVGSQAHPSIFDALLRANRRVEIWDAVHPSITTYDWMIGGGGSVGIKSLCLAAVMGYRAFFVFGMDGSYKNDAHHAYPQPENDAQLTMTIKAAGREFFVPRWGARQAQELMELLPHLLKAGVELDFFGDGLIQWCVKHMIANSEGEKHVG